MINILAHRHLPLTHAAHDPTPLCPGTVTHLAPEMLRKGSSITTAVDVYAFGVLAWSFYTSKKPFDGGCPIIICIVMCIGIYV